MRPTVPSVPLPVWKDLYSAAQKFRALQPWEILGDTDLIGVRDRSGGETGFGVVMGSGSTLFGFCLYRGAEGFHLYRRLMERAIDVERDDFFALQNCLKLELGPRSGLRSEDLSVIQQLGLSFKGKRAWPEFRSLLPGYAPWYLTEAEARLLTLGLEVTWHHVQKVMTGKVDAAVRDGECLVYTPESGPEPEYRSQWEPWPVPVAPVVAPPALNLARLNALLAKKLKPDTPWEAEVLYLPSLIMDHERPYYFRIAAVCQQSTGFAFIAEASLPEPSVEQLLADAICSSIERHGFLPQTIFVNNEQQSASLAPLGKALGFTIQRQKKLGATRMLKEDMAERFVLGGGGRRKK